MPVKKSAKPSKTSSSNRKRSRRRKSRKRKPAGSTDHTLKFINHYQPFKAEPYEPPRTDDYGVVPNLFQPITAEELEFQRKFRRRR